MSELKPMAWAHMPSARPATGRRVAARALQATRTAAIVVGLALFAGGVVAPVGEIAARISGCGAC